MTDPLFELWEIKERLRTKPLYDLEELGADPELMAILERLSFILFPGKALDLYVLISYLMNV